MSRLISRRVIFCHVVSMNTTKSENFELLLEITLVGIIILSLTVPAFLRADIRPDGTSVNPSITGNSDDSLTAKPQSGELPQSRTKDSGTDRFALESTTPSPGHGRPAIRVGPKSALDNSDKGPNTLESSASVAAEITAIQPESPNSTE